MKWPSALLLLPGLTLATSSPVDSDSVTGVAPYIIQPEPGEPCNPDQDEPTCSSDRYYVLFCPSDLAKWVPTMECREVLCSGRKATGDGEPIPSCFPEHPKKLPDWILHELNAESSPSDSESSNNNQPRRIPNPECDPGDQKCDASHSIGLYCNAQGTWEVKRKCSKPGCCEVIAFQNGLKPYAGCKKECGPASDMTPYSSRTRSWHHPSLTISIPGRTSTKSNVVVEPTSSAVATASLSAARVPNPECEPGKMKCDASFYAAMICDEQGTWKVSRKCLKPGCCELAQETFGTDVVARCRKECGPGQTPPGNIPSSTESKVVAESTSASTPAEETSGDDTPYGAPTTLARVVLAA